MPNPAGPRLYDFQDLMRYRIMDVLLVSTPYDAFLLEEVGELEQTLGEFRNLDLHYAPGLTGASTGASALELARQQQNLDLIITTPHVGDMSAAELARRIRDAGIDIPVVLLAWDASELNGTVDSPDSAIERAFLWQGDARILVAILKSVEDWRNVEHDAASVGIQVILLIEDNVRNYSSFLPEMYRELLHHSQRVSLEGLNTSRMILRMRARPKILLCTHFAEAERAFREYGDQVLGIISDVEFPRERGGTPLPRAGADFAEMARKIHPDIPIVLHSSKPENRRLAQQLGTSFLLKDLKGPPVLQELRDVMLRDFSFGDFVFRDSSEGPEIDRAADLRSLEEKLRTIPEKSLLYHSARNHFSRWLKARTEFPLAYALRPRKIEDYPSPRALRDGMIEAIAEYRLDQSQAVVAQFNRSSFRFSTDFYRIGDGSLGGKARGLAFVRRLLSQHRLRRHFPGVEICVPPAVVLATGVFEQFLDQNDLRRFAVEREDEGEIRKRFEEASFPQEAALDVATFLDRATWPLAVRSSSLLEDSRNQPFTGVYDTLMLRNNAASLDERLEQVKLAVKRVWASMFTRAAKAYLLATSHSLEEERMAVILQKIIGAVHGSRFYPDFSGVARSYNFYPSPPMTAREGVTAVALGLGRAIVEGGDCLRFCPHHPQHVPQLASVPDVLASTQREFWALSMTDGGSEGDDLGMREEAFGLDVAERDGTLTAMGSTYSPDNDMIYDGLSRSGTRVVTFAPVLKHGLFPLADVLKALTEVGEEGMGTPVEIELAVNLSVPRGQPKELGVLQMRPLALARESEAIEIGDTDPAVLLCHSRKVLGNGRLEGIRDLVVVDFKRFERARSQQAAAEVGRLNGLLLARGTPYILIGVGRWGSRDPWLGLPVTWDQVAGAKVIVEAGLRDLKVTPSQGSHFFQNLTAFHVGYFTIAPEDGFVDWDWLDAQPDLSHEVHVRHIRLDQPMLVKMNGRKGEGVILKPASV
ncbi:MAG TPA: PEP/pyruvate-binding domain-containing protein [Thermoanaerobaculia bacterium]|nr:PEP/pyruvate-binding domain-containing protein [Thermoanaerobaculia bacterium]